MTRKVEKKIEIEGKTCQNAENKQTFDLTRKNQITGKTRQNAENKQTLAFRIKKMNYNISFKDCLPCQLESGGLRLQKKFRKRIAHDCL